MVLRNRRANTILSNWQYFQLGELNIIDFVKQSIYFSKNSTQSNF